MKRFLFVVLIVNLIISACKRTAKQIDTESKKICSVFLQKEKRIIMPDSLIDIRTGELFEFKSNNLDTYMLHTLDISCDGCVKMLDKLSGYFKQIQKKYGIRVIILASTLYVNEEIKELLSNYPFPILLDESENFKIENKILRDDILCSFLIFESKAIAVGDLKNVFFRDSFNETLRGIYSNEKK